MCVAPDKHMKARVSVYVGCPRAQGYRQIPDHLSERQCASMGRAPGPNQDGGFPVGLAPLARQPGVPSTHLVQDLAASGYDFFAVPGAQVITAWGKGGYGTL